MRIPALNMALKIYLAQYTLLILAIVYVTQIILMLYSIIPYSTVLLVYLVVQVAVQLVLIQFLLNVETEYYELLGQLKETRRKLSRYEK